MWENFPFLLERTAEFPQLLLIKPPSNSKCNMIVRTLCKCEIKFLLRFERFPCRSCPQVGWSTARDYYTFLWSPMPEKYEPGSTVHRTVVFQGEHTHFHTCTHTEPEYPKVAAPFYSVYKNHNFLFNKGGTNRKTAAWDLGTSRTRSCSLIGAV